MASPIELPPMPAYDQAVLGEGGRLNIHWFNWFKAFENIFRNPDALPTPAPLDAPYLLVGANDPTLTGDRRLVAGTGISLTDGGAGGALTVANTLTPIGGALIVPTVSGTVASLTNLPAAKLFIVSYQNVQHNSGSVQTLRCALSVNNGSSYGTPRNVSTTLNSAVGFNANGMITRIDQGGNFVISGSVTSIDNAVSGTVNALQFSWSAGSFIAGDIGVYALN